MNWHISKEYSPCIELNTLERWSFNVAATVTLALSVAPLVLVFMHSASWLLLWILLVFVLGFWFLASSQLHRNGDPGCRNHKDSGTTNTKFLDELIESWKSMSENIDFEVPVNEMGASEVYALVVRDLERAILNSKIDAM